MTFQQKYICLNNINKMNTIAIIPAKQHSDRCKNKNIRHFNGIQLFLYSVQYAIQEGITPVVSTDSEEIIAICNARGIQVVEEKVDDSNIVNCIQQVLNKITCDAFLVLLPTSPLRIPGLGKEMINDLLQGVCETNYTATPIKPIGHFDGKFRISYRSQDTKNKFLFFDGNIHGSTTEFFNKNKKLFDDNSKYYVNKFPCNLQIDTEDEFTALETLSTIKDFQQYLPEFKPIKVCIVSNRLEFKYNYSKFIDSCDQVIRVSKMCNLDTGLTGTRTDIAVVNVNGIYLMYSKKRRHIKQLLNTPKIFLFSWGKRHISRFIKEINLKKFYPYPNNYFVNLRQLTTFAYAVVLAKLAFPEAKLYCLADTDLNKRTRVRLHRGPQSQDGPFIDYMISSNQLTNILEKDEPVSKIKEFITQADKDQKSMEDEQDSSTNSELDLIQRLHTVKQEEDRKNLLLNTPIGASQHM